MVVGLVSIDAEGGGTSLVLFIFTKAGLKVHVRVAVPLDKLQRRDLAPFAC